MNENGFYQVTATGAPITIKAGFVPAKVEVVNITDANKPTLVWYRGMAAASAIKNQNSGRSVITTLGITPVGNVAGDAVEQGVTIGADATVNVNGNTLLVFLTRGGEGNQF